MNLSLEGQQARSVRKRGKHYILERTNEVSYSGSFGKYSHAKDKKLQKYKALAESPKATFLMGITA